MANYKRQQEKCSTSDIESAPSNDTLAETLDAINSNILDKDLDTSDLDSSNRPTTQSFLLENLVY